MPIYEYTCTQCGTSHDFLQKMDEADKTDCPNCGKSALKKMVSASSFHLKGSGWYVTDFKNPKTETKAKTETPAAAKEKTTDTKTTSKTEE